MKFWAGVLASLLVLSPRVEPGTVHYETIVHRVSSSEEKAEPAEFEGHDINEAERQGMCLWDFMNDRGIEITLENVLVSGNWTDMRGGACFLIGEDDVPME